VASSGSPQRRSSLTALPDSLGGLVELARLILTNCTALTALPGSLVGLTNLNLTGCSSLTSHEAVVSNLKACSVEALWQCSTHGLGLSNPSVAELA